MRDEAPDILLVEDSPDDVAFIRRSFTRVDSSCRLCALPDGAEALRFLFPNDVQADASSIQNLRVVILDLKLPKVNGLEVLRRLKACPETCKIPVVVLSSSREARDIAESYRLGANSYLVKPMDFNVFDASVRALCQYWLQYNQTA